jgi:predicted SAM-dependent methyltransferase
VSFRAKLKGFIHQELFPLEPSARQAFRYSFVDDSLREAFTQNGSPLGPDVKFRAGNFGKWKLLDGKAVYLVKDLGDHLMVVRETHPRICDFLEAVLYERGSRYYTYRWHLRRRLALYGWALKKRWVDKPSKLLVNIGAGTWYVRNWKVLEYNGKWYRFANSFVDFHHDLTSNKRFPFADKSVHLLYSEHVFEHLRDEWCEHIFREAYRSLESGGGFRIVVPDADLIYDRIVKQDTAFFKSWMDRDHASIAESFRTLVGQARTPLDEADFARRLSTMSKEEFLNWCKEGLEYDWERTGEHINWFNFDKLKRMLETAGFTCVRRCEAQQSQFPEARGPEFDTRAWYSVHVECVK